MSVTYLLFVPGTRGPTVRHKSLKAAREEAKRILDTSPAQQVLVCRYVEGLSKRVTVAYEPVGPNPLPTREDLEHPF